MNKNMLSMVRDGFDRLGWRGCCASAAICALALFVGCAADPGEHGDGKAGSNVAVDPNESDLATSASHILPYVSDDGDGGCFGWVALDSTTAGTLESYTSTLSVDEAAQPEKGEPVELTRICSAEHMQRVSEGTYELAHAVEQGVSVAGLPALAIGGAAICGIGYGVAKDNLCAVVEGWDAARASAGIIGTVSASGAAYAASFEYLFRLLTGSSRFVALAPALKMGALYGASCLGGAALAEALDSIRRAANFSEYRELSPIERVLDYCGDGKD